MYKYVERTFQHQEQAHWNTKLVDTLAVSVISTHGFLDTFSKHLPVLGFENLSILYQSNELKYDVFTCLHRYKVE